ncbi:MAG: DUF6063 family protein [Bacillota bacterium]
MDNKALEIGSKVFFKLLDEKILSNDHNLAYEYQKDEEVRRVVRTMAKSGGLEVLNGNKNLHLIAGSINSNFATSYTHMKSKYSGLKLKKYFHLANVIISIFIYLIDNEKMVKYEALEEGITYHKLENIITKTLERWNKNMIDNDDFEKKWKIDLKRIYPLWINWPIDRKNDNGETSLLKKENRLGFINEALKPLKEQGLIIDQKSELRILPKEELYERIKYLFHRSNRYKKIKKLIEEGIKDA